MKDFTHFNEQGFAKMVDVSEKDITDRVAVATAKVYVNSETYALIKNGGMKKGDVLTTAQIAGIMGAKKTSDIIPMCHNIPLTGVDIEYELDDSQCTIKILATAKCNGKTGVEMESLTAASIAALTIYDMCKAVQRDIRISDIQLEYKAGGKSGEYKRG